MTPKALSRETGTVIHGNCLEELLEKIKPLEITSQTERSLDEAVKTTWNNALSEVKKLL